MHAFVVLGLVLSYQAKGNESEMTYFVSNGM